MEEDQADRGAAAVPGVHVIEHELVAIGRLEPLAPEADEAATSGDASPDCLDVRPGDPPGRPEVARIQAFG
jgi:hypothetical protein